MWVSELVVMHHHFVASLEGTIDADIKWLESSSRVEWQGEYHNAVVYGIFHSSIGLVALDVVNNHKYFIFWSAVGLFMDIFNSLKPALPIHPVAFVEYALHSMDGDTQKLVIYSLARNYKDRRQELACSINYSNQVHACPSLLRYLCCDRLARLALYLHWLDNSGDAALIHIEDPVRGKFIFAHG